VSLFFLIFGIMVLLTSTALTRNNFTKNTKATLIGTRLVNTSSVYGPLSCSHIWRGIKMLLAAIILLTQPRIVCGLRKVYEMVERRLSVRPSVCPIDRVRTAGLLLSAPAADRRYRSTAGVGSQQQRRHSTEPRHSAVNTGSVMSTAEGRGWTQTCSIWAAQTSAHLRQIEINAVRNIILFHVYFILWQMRGRLRSHSKSNRCRQRCTVVNNWKLRGTFCAGFDEHRQQTRTTWSVARDSLGVISSTV